jgi:hypothetical protein
MRKDYYSGRQKAKTPQQKCGAFIDREPLTCRKKRAHPLKGVGEHRAGHVLMCLEGTVPM